MWASTQPESSSVWSFRRTGMSALRWRFQDAPLQAFGQCKSGVIERLEETLESGQVRIKVLLVIPPASHRRSVKRLAHVRVGRRIHPLRARVLVKLQHTIFETQAQESQH